MWKFLRIPFLVLGVLIMLPIMALSLLKRKFLGKSRPTPPKSVTEDEIGVVERRLGFALPANLQDFYLSGRHHRRAPSGEFYSLTGAAKEYRMLTAKPYGPNGEDWPANLFPFEDLLHGYAAYDRDTGLVTLWDPDEIAGGNEGRAAWQRSFQPTGKTLADYIAR